MYTENARQKNTATGKPEDTPLNTRSKQRETVRGFGHRGPAQAAPAGPDVTRRTIGRASGPQRHSAPEPIWFAALVASDCRASGKGGEHAVCWHCELGRAVYTNCGSHPERIEALGVHLRGGDTLSVTWIPGDTAYTVEVLHTLDYVA